MLFQPSYPAGNARLAGAHVDECRADVWAVAERLVTPRVSPGLPTTLHRSVSALIRQEVARLTRHDPEAYPLPPDLHAEVGRWKAALGPRQLKPLVEERVSQWRRALTELLHRLHLDWPALRQSFGLSSDARLASISPPLGDPHNGGRSVYKVAFDDGNAIVYKPRPVDGEFTFGRIVEWLRENGCKPTLSFCRTLPRAGYGWTQFVKWEYCTTLAEATAYYERQGGFLALFLLLGGRDCISENLVVARDHPVWVDLECLCGPILPWAPKLPYLPEWMRDSVLSTNLIFSARGRPVSSRRNTGLAVSCLADRSATFTGDGVLRHDHIEAVKRGFGDVYAWMCAQKSVWLSCSGFPSWWQSGQVRVLPKDTGWYMAFSDALHIVPRDDAAALRRSIEAALRHERGTASWVDTMVAAELRALGHGDIPYWTTSPGSHDLRESGGAALRGVACQSGLGALHQRANRLSMADAQSQVWLIDRFLRLQLPT